jgi:hypothetical protein
MEKRTILKIISIIMAVIAIFAIVCAATVTGGGFIDLSNVVKIPCIFTAIICAVLSIVLWKRSKK